MSENPGSSGGWFWWQISDQNIVFPFTFPADRVEAARERIRINDLRLSVIVPRLTRKAKSAEEAVREVARWVQDAVIHNPIYQPAECSRLYALASEFGYDLERTRFGRIVATLLGQRSRLISDPMLLAALGEARSQQCAGLLKAAVEQAGFKASTLMLNNHTVNEVVIDGVNHIVDADAFKNQVFIEGNGKLVTTKALMENPYLADRFKPTGWMFRRGSLYARNLATEAGYSGYLDLYSPEIDGQISARFGAKKKLLPPGVPVWTTPIGNTVVGAGRNMAAEFSCNLSERATGYRVRCGRRSRGYTYDRLILDNLNRETSSEMFEFETRENNFEVPFSEPGQYYVSVAAIPHYIEEYPSYLWWSDELVVRVL